jgi:hypothetical protein
MSSKRRQIMNEIVSALKLIDGTTETLPNSPRSPYTFCTNVFTNVFAKQEYLSTLNDFPSICCYPISSETRARIGDAQVFSSFILEVRGYVYSDDNPIEKAADLAQDIQYIIDSMKYRSTFKDLNVTECRVQSLSTDEGIMEPYGVVEIRALIVYIQDSNI